MNLTTLISTAELARGIDDPDLAVVDCRYDLGDADAGERAYRAGHLPPAQYKHIDRHLAGVKTGANGRHPLPEASVLVATLGRAGIDTSTQVVAYDQSNGMWASRLWWLLQWLGHERVAVLDGGIDKWMRESRAITRDPPRVRPAKFDPRRPTPVASAAEILADLSVHSLKVIDARAAERFRGDVEPIDPVAGHIPGAINRPYSANLSSEATFKSAAELHKEFSALLDGAAPASVVHQCGSGVTACHNVLAMAVAGLPGSRLYPGSWSEWIADPARPIARGD
jgi:thiosulfate/3-mercaptopyruvate sulfurtransferase